MTVRTKQYVINENTTVLDAQKKISTNKYKILIVENDKKHVIGILTLGDFYKVKLVDINRSKVSKIINKKFQFIKEEKKIIDLIININNPNILHVPVIKNKKLIKILFYDEILKKLRKITKIKKNYCSLIIMAGGNGKRMRGLNNFTPKPLLNSKRNVPIIFEIINKFKKYNFEKKYVSVYYKKQLVAERIKSKFKESVTIIQDKKKLGSIGSLRNINDSKSKCFFVINCDTILDFNINLAISFHKKNNNDVTIISCLSNKNYNYGVINLSSNLNVKSINEKPVSSILLNTGSYIISQQVTKLIPKNKFFNTDQLINVAIKKKLKIKTFSIFESMWTDIGTKEKYISYLNT